MSILSDSPLSPLLDRLENTPAGRVCLHVSPEIPEHLAALELSQIKGESFSESQFIAHTFNPLPPLETVLDDTLAALAEVALALWPAWYGRPTVAGDEEKRAHPLPEPPPLSLHPAAPSRRLSRPWYSAAAQQCQEGRPPLCRRFPLALQVQQLALALAPRNLVVILTVEESAPAPQRLFGLAKAAEWCAKETAARVAVLIPPSAVLPEEVESLFYGGIRAVPRPLPPQSGPAPETKLRYWPVEGIPHPFSPGEQRLARELAADPALAGLFTFNQRVRTVHGNDYLVDLLWTEGKLVVEVDGFRAHSHRSAFRQDRHRDYELLISGYTTLRLAHDEVLAAMPLVLEKIRTVVRFCHNNRRVSEVSPKESP